MAKAKITKKLRKQSPDFTGNIRDNMGRFKPGFSGNPAGKPPGSISITARIKAELKKIPPGQRMSCLEVLVRWIVRKAIIEGDQRMIELLWNHLDSEFKKELKKLRQET